MRCPSWEICIHFFEVETIFDRGRTSELFNACDNCRAAVRLVTSVGEAGHLDFTFHSRPLNVTSTRHTKKLSTPARPAAVLSSKQAAGLVLNDIVFSIYCHQTDDYPVFLLVVVFPKILHKLQQNVPCPRPGCCAGNGEKLSNSQAESGQAINSAFA